MIMYILNIDCLEYQNNFAYSSRSLHRLHMTTKQISCNDHNTDSQFELYFRV